jgi:hypothetical protein
LFFPSFPSLFPFLPLFLPSSSLSLSLSHTVRRQACSIPITKPAINVSPR